ncbi:MAG: hypothetical protein JNM94_05345 [Phycisphaerae bacterium]|nr:hypothetical protein [Phycisphaerae bacterium]
MHDVLGNPTTNGSRMSVRERLGDARMHISEYVALIANRGLARKRARGLTSRAANP